MIIQFVHADIGYHDGIILSDFSWDIHRGEHWAIVGPNGSGKTTLIKTLLGLLPLQGGEIHFLSKAGTSLKSPNISYLPQLNQIDRKFPITTTEVISSGMIGQRTDKAILHNRTQEIIDQLGLCEQAHHPLSQLSGGQLQRALLGRALISQPEILILDEPMSFLDQEYKLQFEKLLNTLTPKDCTILMVTHDLGKDVMDWKILPVGNL